MKKDQCRHRWMTLCLKPMVIVMALAAFLTVTCALSQGQGNKKDRQVKRVPAGAVVKDNKVTLKHGYEFVNRTSNTVAIRRRRTGNITGTIECNCEGGGGTCKVEVYPDAVYCVNGTCKDDCYVHVVIGSHRNTR